MFSAKLVGWLESASVQIKVGSEISLEDGVSTGRGILAGWKEGKFLFVERRGHADFKEGDQIVGRTFVDGMYVGFSCEILAILQEVNVIITSYPDEAIENRRRKSDRHNVVIPVNVSRSQSTSSVTFPGMITDISLEGIAFQCEMDFRPGDKACISGSLPTGASFAGLELVVRRVAKKEKRSEFGTEIVSEANEAMKAVADFVEALSRFTVKSEEHPRSTDGKAAIPIGAKVVAQMGMVKSNSVIRSVTSHYVLIDTPMELGKPLSVGKGSPAFIRFACGGVVNGFEGIVVKQYTSPSFLWALSRPAHISSTRIRQSERVSTFIPAVLATIDGSFTGVIMDLSEGGGLFATKAEGDVVPVSCGLNFTLPSGENVEGLQCQPCNIKKTGGKTLIGLSFDKGEAKKLKPVRRYYLDCHEKLALQ